ncbi:MAG: aldo/keto reductase [Chitinophagaceae bacterium]|nr:aldo/keto reductase [Chitinophagaceae bacterium]
MILRTIPSSGEKLPAIGMGTWLTFDAGDSETRRNSLKEVLRIFRQHGGKLIDSSPMYGSSEKVAGDIVAELKIRKDIFLATKVWTNGEQNGIVQMKQSFEKMQTATMDLMQVHNLVDAEIHLRTLRNWKAEGKIRYSGITHYVVSAYPDLMELIKKQKPDFVQFNYNIRVRDAEKRLLPFCQDNGIAVINNRPFDGGTLFENVEGKTLPGWAKENEIQNWAQFFLKYIVSHPAVTCAIPATSKPGHMQENIQAAYGLLPDQATRKKMSDFFEGL